MFASFFNKKFTVGEKNSDTSDLKFLQICFVDLALHTNYIPVSVLVEERWMFQLICISKESLHHQCIIPLSVAAV